MACSKCGRSGHNKATCKKKKKKAIARKRTVTCGKCGRTGHNQSTCSRKGATKKTKTKKKSKTVRRATSTTRTRRGRDFAGPSRGWVILYHGGRTGKTQHDKTWAIKVSKSGRGYKVITRWGRRTGEKNETTSSVMSQEKAMAFARRKISEKLSKGYVFAGAKRRRRTRRRI